MFFLAPIATHNCCHCRLLCLDLLVTDGAKSRKCSTTLAKVQSTFSEIVSNQSMPGICIVSNGTSIRLLNPTFFYRFSSSCFSMSRKCRLSKNPSVAEQFSSESSVPQLPNKASTGHETCHHFFQPVSNYICRVSAHLRNCNDFHSADFEYLNTCKQNASTIIIVNNTQTVIKGSGHGKDYWVQVCG